MTQSTLAKSCRQRRLKLALKRLERALATGRRLLKSSESGTVLGRRLGRRKNMVSDAVCVPLHSQEATMLRVVFGAEQRRQMPRKPFFHLPRRRFRFFRSSEGCPEDVFLLSGLLV